MTSPGRKKMEGRAGILTLTLAGVLVGAALVMWTAGEPADLDADGMSDAYETLLGLDPADPADAPLNYDTDRLVNLEESAIWTDPFSGDTDTDGWADDVDANPLSRAVIFWGLAGLTDGDLYRYPGPAWWLGAWREGGDWTAQGWHVPASHAPGSGSLFIEVDGGLLNADLVHEIELIDHPGASLYLDLVDALDEEVATDLYGNLLEGTGTGALRTLKIPLLSHPAAAAIRLRRGVGEVTVNTSVLYVDADGDGLDADQEAQLGTSDANNDSDGDGVGDGEEVEAGTDPTDQADVPPGAAAAPLSEKSIAASPASAETAAVDGLSALALFSNQFGAVYSSPLGGGAVMTLGCTEYGPYYTGWDCAVQGASNTAGSLSATQLEVLVNETIQPPTLEAMPTFQDGAMRYWVSNTCPENVDHWETNTIRYLPGELFFDPPIPASITNACTNVYTAMVTGEPASIAGWWPGEESTADRIWTNSAALSGSVSYAVAKVGQGFQLSALGDYVEIPASPRLDVGTTPGLSFECWIKPTSTAMQPIFEWKKGPGNLYGAHLWIFTGGHLWANLYDIHDGWHYFRTYSPPVHTNALQHVAVTYDHGSGVARIYHDAVVVASANLGQFVPETSSDLLLGKRIGWQTQFYGIIDEPSVYHCSLSSNDVAAIYNAGSVGKRWYGAPTNGAALPAGCVCDPVTSVVGEVTIAVYADSDEDGMPDWWELEHGLNPTSGVPADLAAWWRFDEGSGTNVENAVSDAFDGYTVGMGSNNWVAGKLGTALSFDGTNDYVLVPQNPAIITGTQFTVSAWVWLEDDASAQYHPALTDMLYTDYVGYWLGFDTDYGDQLEIFWGSGGANYSAIGSTNEAEYVDAWAHAAATCDGTNMTFYLNGDEIASTNAPAFAPAMTNLYIGADIWGYRWKGLIDETRIYTSALAGNQVATMYDALQDPDGDGLSNLEEYTGGSDPNNRFDPGPLSITISFPNEGQVLP